MSELTPEIAILGLAAIYSTVIFARGEIALWDSGILVGLFVIYLWLVSRNGAESNDHLLGPSATVAALPKILNTISDNCPSPSYLNNIINTVWKWLHTSEHELQGLVGEINNKVIAFAHYRRMPSPLRGKDIGFLDDLYVLPEYRGQKIGEKLIKQLKQISIDKKWNLVRWITRDNNIRAKKVYDKVSNKTNWNIYELSS